MNTSQYSIIIHHHHHHHYHNIQYSIITIFNQSTNFCSLLGFLKFFCKVYSKIVIDTISTELMSIAIPTRTDQLTGLLKNLIFCES